VAAVLPALVMVGESVSPCQAVPLAEAPVAMV